MLQNVIYTLLTDPSPGQDLFSEAWTEGNLYSIQPIVNVLGTFAVWVISIVGFGIVIFSILKNALSGLYVINPKLWEKVDAVKQQMTDGATGFINEHTQKGNQAIKTIGTFASWLLSLLPNVKALTDFDEDAQVDKKQYFMKSIPLLVVQIFIGTIIFMGYPAKIAEWVGGAGTYVIASVINNVDPVTVITNATDKFTHYQFATSGSTDPFEQSIYDMAYEMTKVMGTKYGDMSTDNVQNVAYQIEQNLLSAFNSNGARTVLGANGGGYECSVSAIIQTSTPAVSEAYQDIGNGVKQAMATNGTVSFKYWIQASSLLTAQHTTRLGANDYMVWTVTATPVAVSNISTANVIVCAGISGTPVVNGNNFSITITGITVGNGTDDIKGSLGKVVSVEFINSAGNVVDTFNATLQTASVGQMSGATPILTFSSSDKDRYVSAQNQSTYMRIALVGEWSKTVQDNNTQTTVRITEFRLALNYQNVSWLLSTWTDVDSQKYTGVPNLTSDVLRQTNSSGN